MAERRTLNPEMVQVRLLLGQPAVRRSMDPCVEEERETLNLPTVAQIYPIQLPS